VLERCSGPRRGQACLGLLRGEGPGAVRRAVLPGVQGGDAELLRRRARLLAALFG
jgi:hypothetical protein